MNNQAMTPINSIINYINQNELNSFLTAYNNNGIIYLSKINDYIISSFLSHHDIKIFKNVKYFIDNNTQFYFNYEIFFNDDYYYLDNLINNGLNIDQVNKIIYLIFKKINILHCLNIVHNNINTKNILINRAITDAIIIDFSSAFLINPNENNNSTLIEKVTKNIDINSMNYKSLDREKMEESNNFLNINNNLYNINLLYNISNLEYCSFEKLCLLPLNHKTDIWSIGVVILKLLKINNRIINNKVFNLTSYITNKINDINHKSIDNNEILFNIISELGYIGLTEFVKKYQNILNQDINTILKFALDYTFNKHELKTIDNINYILYKKYNISCNDICEFYKNLLTEIFIYDADFRSPITYFLDKISKITQITSLNNNNKLNDDILLEKLNNNINPDDSEIMLLNNQYGNIEAMVNEMSNNTNNNELALFQNNLLINKNKFNELFKKLIK